MAVGITVDGITDEIGHSSLLHAFFSTISAKCEPDGWGTRFPHIMNELYQGKLSHENSNLAMRELRAARKILDDASPSEVVWDYENRDSGPPWGDTISDSITNLGNYFLTPNGRNVFEVIDEALAASVDTKSDATIE